MTKPHHIPPEVQAHLHELGMLDDPDYMKDDHGMAVANAEKLRRYMAENDGQPWF